MAVLISLIDGFRRSRSFSIVRASVLRFFCNNAEAKVIMDSGIEVSTPTIFPTEINRPNPMGTSSVI